MPEDIERLPELDPAELPEVCLSTEQANFLRSIGKDSVMIGDTAVSLKEGMLEKRLAVIDRWPWVVPLGGDKNDNS